MNVPFNRPISAPNALHYIQDAIQSDHVSGDGKYTLKCQELLEQTLGARKVLLTTSGTHALEMAALLTNPDWAIMSPFTFTSTANAFHCHGCRIAFVDIDPRTLNIDTIIAAGWVAGSTYNGAKATIVPVHYAGVGCEIKDWYVLKGNSYVVEDNAHGLFGKYESRYLGTWGDLGCLSFHETKNFTMGEGGALIINNPSLIERAEIIREKGTNRTAFKRGEVDKYTWVSPGSSYLPSDILAAYLWAQLQQWQTIQRKRAETWRYYWYELDWWANRSGIRLPYIPDNCQQSYHMFYLILPTNADRDRFITEMKAHGIAAHAHYVPLHLSPMGERLGYRQGEFPIAEDVAGRLVRLPFYTDMTVQEQDYAIEKVRAFKC
jgi:dTDP-4-amino-4,6-dideoxygalactose transaminase